MRTNRRRRCHVELRCRSRRQRVELLLLPKPLPPTGRLDHLSVQEASLDRSQIWPVVAAEIRCNRSGRDMILFGVFRIGPWILIGV